MGEFLEIWAKYAMSHRLVSCGFLGKWSNLWRKWEIGGFQLDVLVGRGVLGVLTFIRNILFSFQNVAYYILSDILSELGARFTHLTQIKCELGYKMANLIIEQIPALKVQKILYTGNIL